MILEYHPEARKELRRNTTRYKKKRDGLGNEFYNQIMAVVDSIVDNPLAWTKIEPDIRRRLTGHFPFGVIYNYNKKEQKILIVAIMHNRQKPGYWKKRL